MPQAIPPGLKREDVLRTLTELDAGIAHPFGAPTGYELVHQGKRYAPKAVIGLAFRHLIGRILRPDEFSGGEAPGQANHVLRQLGFSVVKKREQNDDEDSRAGQDWTAAEVELIIGDYFDMLQKELLGKPYNKSEHRRRLKPQLLNRKHPSIEFKHRNLSAVLVNLGLPYIDGYKPAKNFQTLLADEVGRFLDKQPHLLDKLSSTEDATTEVAPEVEGLTFESIAEPPPEPLELPKEKRLASLSRRARKIDFAEHDAQNRPLGDLGEEFVLKLEKQRLLALGRDDLSSKVKWASKTDGDGLGYDVLSFEPKEDAEKWIEVKTTRYSKYFPFYVTATELLCSEQEPAKFSLYRLFNFSKSPRLFVLAGSLRNACQLEPVVFRFSFCVAARSG